MERPLSAARKASVEERDSEEMACRVRQAIQRENNPVQSPELFSRSTVRLPLPFYTNKHFTPQDSPLHLIWTFEIAFDSEG